MIDDSEREHLLRIYAQTRTIAVVGASADESKAAKRVPRYLQSRDIVSCRGTHVVASSFVSVI